MIWTTGELLVVTNCSVIYVKKAWSDPNHAGVELRAGDLAVFVGTLEGYDVLFHSRTQSLVLSPGDSWFKKA